MPVWYYDLDGAARKGPVTLDELMAMIKDGRVRPSSKVWSEGKGVISAGMLASGITEADGVTPWLLPVGRSGLAIAAGYCGLLSFIPGVHLVAIVLAALAMRQLSRRKELRGWGRVIFGLVTGIVFTVIYSATFVFHR